MKTERRIVMTFEGLCFLSGILLVWLIICDIHEVIKLDERLTQERRERFRQTAYAAMRRERTKKQNREKLWEEHNDYHIN
jgi:hypothetical protein